MDNQTKEKYLKMALVVFGIVFLLVYPLGVIWPAGWIWHGGQGTYYFQMICGIYAVLGIFLNRRSAEPGGESQPDCLHHLVERRACGDHGGAGLLRQSGTWSPRWRCSGPAGGRGHSLVPLAEGGTVCRGHGLTRSAHRFNLSLDPDTWAKPLDLPQFDSMPS